MNAHKTAYLPEAEFRIGWSQKWLLLELAFTVNGARVPPNHASEYMYKAREEHFSAAGGGSRCVLGKGARSGRAASLPVGTSCHPCVDTIQGCTRGRPRVLRNATKGTDKGDDLLLIRFSFIHMSEGAGYVRCRFIRILAAGCRCSFQYTLQSYDKIHTQELFTVACPCCHLSDSIVFIFHIIFHI